MSFRRGARWLVPSLALSLATLLATPPEVHALEVVEDQEEYAKAGTLELGGSMSLSWGNDVFSIEAGPSIGFFFWDRIELSLLIDFDYTRIHDDATDTSTDVTSSSFLLEPSYHHQIHDELYVFAGLGVGLSTSASDLAFEVDPRVGLNIEIGRSGVFTPALEMPIRFGNDSWVGLEIEMGFTTSW
jgi:hypothetical protein